MTDDRRFQVSVSSDVTSELRRHGSAARGKVTDRSPGPVSIEETLKVVRAHLEDAELGVKVTIEAERK